MIKYGVTGGISSGKSLFINYLKEKKERVLCADEIYHDLLLNNKEMLNSIKKNFTETVFTENKIDRKKLSAIVFNNPKKLKLLNKTTHPFVLNEMNKLISIINNKRIFISVPLLFEIKMEKYFDKIINIFTYKKNQLKWLRKRNGFTIKESLKRINSQISIYDKSKKSNFVLKNIKTKKYFYKQIDKLLKQL